MKLGLLGVIFGLVAPHSARADVIVCDNVTGNLISNCGFETGDFTGWTQGGNTNFTTVAGSLTVGGGGTTYNPNSGSWQAELGPTGSDGTLSQTFATTAGDIYQIEFYMAGEGGSGSDFGATFDGTTLLSVNPAPGQLYALYTYTLAATGSSSTLSFNFRNDTGFQLLDDVSVSDLTGVTPEPGTYVLLCIGLAGLIVAVRRGRTGKTGNA